jgi:hypothetical protein
MPTQKKHTLLTVYLGLVSLISFIWLAIAIIIFTHKIISLNIISDDEYISQNHREMDRCEEPIYLWDDTKERTEEQKETCITKAKENLMLQRKVDAKEIMILSWLRGIILLIIFPLHFVYFKKNNK